MKRKSISKHWKVHGHNVGKIGFSETSKRPEVANFPNDLLGFANWSCLKMRKLPTISAGLPLFQHLSWQILGDQSLKVVKFESPSHEVYGCFQKQGWAPQIIHFNKVFNYKPSILVVLPLFLVQHPYKWSTHPNPRPCPNVQQASANQSPSDRFLLRNPMPPHLYMVKK